MWMNEAEIDEALDVIGERAPRFLPYVKYLSDWRHIVNQNSDGWPYWTAGSRAASNLMELIQRIMSFIRGRGGVEPSIKELDRSLAPIKSIATRKKLPVPALGEEGEEDSGRLTKDDAKFVLWVENTLVPDLKESGTVETAADFERLIRIIRRLATS